MLGETLDKMLKKRYPRISILKITAMLGSALDKIMLQARLDKSLSLER